MVIKFVCVTLLTAFAISVITITGIREFLMIRSNKFFYKLLNCDFCLSFWTSLIIVACIQIYNYNSMAWLLPFLTTPLIKRLI